MARVLIMGAGGVGGYFGAALADSGHDVVFVARGSNLDALRASGLRVTGSREILLPSVAAVPEAASAGACDLVLLCVKSYDLEEASRAVAACGGLAVTLQNGVDAADRARTILGDAVLAGSTNIVADLEAPGHVRLLSRYARIRFGEPEGGLSERVAMVAGWLDVPGIEPDPREDVRIALWEKMATICAVAGTTTMCRAPVGAVLADPSGVATFRRLTEECETVARAQGVPLPADFTAQRLSYASGIDPAATSSMLRDLLRGKRVEIEHLNGHIVRLARERHLDVPVNEAVLAAVRIAASACLNLPEGGHHL